MSDEVRLLIAGDNFGKIEAEFLNINPQTKDAIHNALPFEGAANVWGDEIYFNIPVTASEENGQQDMEIGDVAFWPMGNAMCIFFGKTPVSDSEKPKAYSPVNLFARIIGDAMVLKQVKDGDVISVKRTEPEI
jgi:hypothetical protein